jgi:hypothetical protein
LDLLLSTERDEPMFVVDGGAGGVFQSLRPDAADLLQDEGF